MVLVKFSLCGLGDGGVGDSMYTRVWDIMVTVAGVDDAGGSFTFGVW